MAVSGMSFSNCMVSRNTPIIIVTSTTNIAKLLYSRPRNAAAPSWTALPISFIVSVPWSSCSTLRASKAENTKATRPVASAIVI